MANKRVLLALALALVVVLAAIPTPGAFAQKTPEINAIGPGHYTSPDFRSPRIIDLPASSGGWSSQMWEQNCEGDNFTIFAERRDRAATVDVLVNGEKLSQELNAFLADNLFLTPSSWDLQHVLCSRGGTREKLAFIFFGVRQIGKPDQNRWSAPTDVGSLVVYVTNGRVDGMAFTPSPQNLVTDTYQYLKDNGMTRFPGYWDRDFCKAGPPCAEFYPESGDEGRVD